ncbi:MAG: motif domain protein [Subtercola sp.]|nr:motif domain protein [Subtercola sp.]
MTEVPDARAWPTPAPSERCPCLSGNPYGECCRPFHTGAQSPPTAERLMRSRYSAFVVGDAAYLLASWHPSTRPAAAELSLDPAQRWYRLDIVNRTGGGMLDQTGTVEFVARYRLGTERSELRETSTFEKLGGKWFYLAG